MAPDPGVSLRRLTSAVGEGLTRDAMGALVSREVALWVPHDALNLVGLNPVSGTVSFGFWHRYPRDLARAEMLNCFLGDDSMRPIDLARRRVPIGMVRVESRHRAEERRAESILSAHGAACELRLLLRSGRNLWGVLCLFREEGRSLFGADDADRLVRLSPVLTAALRGYVQAGPAPVGPALPPGVIVVGGDHVVRGVTAQARAWLAELRDAGASDWLFSPEWAAVSLASETSPTLDTQYGARPRICVPAAHARRWVALHAQPLEGGSGDMAVVVQAATGELLLPAFAAWYGLTPRERCIVDHLQAGLAQKQIAHRLGLSPYTVSDHLKAVFRKTHTHSRDELMAILCGG
ncbi:helix-turn-helix transcriptional regulator [Streptomyces sp. NPDC058308]|uniref:helix-turn-helix transcriptional regulator n=1 Tax=Streptomyces sp. NPDC058308 TaxID=3346440 RepID=UPI0036EC635D